MGRELTSAEEEEGRVRDKERAFSKCSHRCSASLFHLFKTGPFFLVLVIRKSLITSCALPLPPFALVVSSPSLFPCRSRQRALRLCFFFFFSPCCHITKLQRQHRHHHIRTIGVSKVAFEHPSPHVNWSRQTLRDRLGREPTSRTLTVRGSHDSLPSAIRHASGSLFPTTREKQAETETTHRRASRPR